nr:L,D-transpeptidase family protein [Francisella sp. FSC1006]
MWFFKKDKQNHWLVIKSAIPTVVGKNGLAWADSSYQQFAKAPEKREGDNKAPAGIFNLGKTFGFSNELLSNSEYIPLTTGIRCVDDSNSKYYNQIVDSDSSNIQKDWQSSENMPEVQIYKYGIEVLYNTNPAIPEKGSCIFMHIWKSSGTGTEGCTAMAEKDIKDIQQALDTSKDPVLVQLPQNIYNQVQQAWNLPNLSQGN